MSTDIAVRDVNAVSATVVLATVAVAIAVAVILIVRGAAIRAQLIEIIGG